MSETQRTGRDLQREELEGAVELIDYLRVIWKRKYLIIVGTLVSAVAAGVISFTTPAPKVYRAEMIIRPGIVGRNVNGKADHIDSPEIIKATIDAGVFEEEILSATVEPKGSKSATSFNLKVATQEPSDALKVSCETSRVDRSTQILSTLAQLLSKKYSKQVAYYQGDYERQIISKNRLIAGCEAERHILQQYIKITESRIDEAKREIELVKKNADSLFQGRNRPFSKDSDDRIVLSAILHMDTVSRNIALVNNIRGQIKNYTTEIQGHKLELERLDSKRKELSEDIKHLESRKNNVENIKILCPPTRRPLPIKSARLNVMLATVVGLFAMLFVAFFFEYAQKHK